MKRSLTVCSLLVILVTIIPSPVTAQNNCRATLTTGLFNQYLGKPGISLYKGAWWVTDINQTCGEWSFGVWGAAGLGSSNIFEDHLGNEIDLYINWRRRFQWAELFIQLSYFALDLAPDGFKHVSEDQWIVDAEFSLHYWQAARPYIAYRYFGGIGNNSPDPGSFYWIGVRREQQLWFRLPRQPDMLALNLDVQTAFSDGPLGGRSGLANSRLSVSTEIVLTQSLSFLPNITWQVAPTGKRRYADSTNEFQYGCFIRYRFN